MKWNAFRKSEKNEEQRIIEEIKKLEESEMEQSEAPKTTVTKKCEICGKEFEADKMYANITKYCSDECRKKRNTDAKREYAARYYKEKTLKKRQAQREAKATIIESKESNLDFFTKTEFALEIMKIADLNDEISLKKLIMLIEKYVG